MGVILESDVDMLPYRGGAVVKTRLVALPGYLVAPPSCTRLTLVPHAGVNHRQHAAPGHKAATMGIGALRPCTQRSVTPA